MNTPSKVPTLARLAFRIPPERRAEFEAVYSRRLLPILKAHGLIESSDPGRPTPDDVFARLFEVGAVSDVSEKQEALRKDPAWREVLSVLERDSRPAQPGGAFRTNLSLYAAPAGPGRRIPLLLPKAEPAGRGKGHWRSYDATDGLEGDTVWTMFQDRRGDLWFGGGGGVVRWDGQRFTRFRAADGLTFFPRVLAILEDRRGDLWFGGGGGAVRWDGETSTHFTATEGMPLPVVATIHEDGRGDLWFGGSGGAVRWDGRTFTTFSGGDGPSLARILAIHEDRRGDIWFAGDGGAVRWDGQTFTPITAKNGPGSNQVRGICMDRDGVLWFSTSGGVRRYDGKIWDAVTTRDGLINNDVYSVFQDRDGAFWFGTHGGVSRYDGKE
ncbi:MAG: hypothetical protein O2954_18650, partial [bacterium]|nr:hypothetical protein [bacterium]